MKRLLKRVWKTEQTVPESEAALGVERLLPRRSVPPQLAAGAQYGMRHRPADP
jgi:hypothetical protein